MLPIVKNSFEDVLSSAGSLFPTNSHLEFLSDHGFLILAIYYGMVWGPTASESSGIL